MNLHPFDALSDLMAATLNRSPAAQIIRLISDFDILPSWNFQHDTATCY